MTQGPDDDPTQPQPPYGEQPQQPQQPQYGQQPYGQPGQQPASPYGGEYGGGHGSDYGGGYGAGYGGGYGALGAGPDAPYGRHPVTGVPYSDKQKLVAGLLQILVPLGIGRMYMGDTGIGVAQLLVTLVTCGLGALWPFIDGILILVGDKTDAQGRPLRG